MDTLIEKLKELLKSYTIAGSVANATKRADDIAHAQSLLDQINVIRLSLAINAEMREIFYLQRDIPLAVNAGTTQNIFVSKNDINYTLKRGIAAKFLVDATISLINQGAREVEITRNPVPWQHLFSEVQAGVLGQQIPFDFPETLLFNENQSLGLGIKGQTQAAFLFFHGATLKEDLQESSIAAIQKEFVNEDGITKYIPETQIVPIEFKFLSNAVDAPATDANGDNQIFSLKNERSVLLTEASTTALDMRVSISDEGKNLEICDTIEMRGIAGSEVNPFTTYYPLPEPHLLRRGDRLKIKGLNSSLITNNEMEANILNYLTFRGITL